jgi:aerobic-type carbon monoxide dehydrogenase small subunit (CoxS/CutS family)
MADQHWKLRVNGRTHTVNAAGDTPLLYVLQGDLALKGPRFGCGLAQCGSCSVLLDGREIRSCVTPISTIAGRSVTTLEGIPDWYAKRKGLSEAPQMHPVQEALLAEQAPQCGYCMNGIVIKAAELLSTNPHPTEDQVRAALNGHLCRCGTYPSIIKAVLRAVS